LTSEYLLWLLNGDVMHEIVSGYANGTTVNMLPAAGLQRPLICIPPEPLIEAFTAFCRGVMARSGAALDSGITIAALRDGLLPGLISGRDVGGLNA
jgi:type I restriction enzyme S subunit